MPSPATLPGDAEEDLVNHDIHGAIAQLRAAHRALEQTAADLAAGVPGESLEHRILAIAELIEEQANRLSATTTARVGRCHPGPYGVQVRS